MTEYNYTERTDELICPHCKSALDFPDIGDSSGWISTKCPGCNKDFDYECTTIYHFGTRIPKKEGPK
jgi:uncharacterized CHY-type Zn-finger protein